MTDSKKVWKGIRQLVNLKSRSGSTPTKLLVEDVEINVPKSMAANPDLGLLNRAEKRKWLRHCPAASNVGSSARSFKMIGIIAGKKNICA